jgi:hypothetical protein
MKGICVICGLKDVEVSSGKLDDGKEIKLCNQCRSADGAYGN